MICTRCEGTLLPHNNSSERALPSTGLRCYMWQGFACSWENQSSCCSLRINGTMKVEFEVGEVSKGAARGSRKPFHTAPMIVASLIRCRYSRNVWRVPRLREMSCPPPLSSPSTKKKQDGISSVCISFSVNV